MYKLAAKKLVKFIMIHQNEHLVNGLEIFSI